MLEITFENSVVEFWLPKLLTFQKKTPSYRFRVNPGVFTNLNSLCVSGSLLSFLTLFLGFFELIFRSWRTF